MTTLDFTRVDLNKLVTHFVGNKLRDEKVVLSNQISDIKEDTLEYLLKYFLLSFKPIDFYNFSHPARLEMNEIYTLIKKIFNNTETFIPESKNIAKLLYEYSNHPKIKEGKLSVTYFKNVIYGDTFVDAIGIFKSENDVPFIKMNSHQINYSIEHEFGFEIKGIDKGCLIFNTDVDLGYSVLVVDNVNKFGDAQYWVNDFLKLKPFNDIYHNTKDFMSIAKNFVTKKLSAEYDVSKTDKIDLLNRTMEYFKSNESFDKNEFEQNVFQDEDLINSFRDFDNSFRVENEIELNDNFEISSQAVKKQTRTFKSVLKLDKNFHVYIHGKKDLIEKGVESDGRKFYKIYYDKEE
jgi:37-kD nucleoid-associated bacterial protein